MKDLLEIVEEDTIKKIELEDVGRLDKAIAELRDRIPELFEGPVCPSDHYRCKCTYETGCLALKYTNENSGL